MDTKQKTYKRTDRSVSPETAKKISDSLRKYNAEHPRPDSWRKNISNGLRFGYWDKSPPKKQDTTIQDIML